MTDLPEDNESDELADAINDMAEKVSKTLLKEYMALPKELQIGLVLIRTTQLILSNILCHVAMDIEELTKLADEQGEEIKDLTQTCATSGFSDKFGKH